jgi:hypothetical protein
MPIPRIIRAEVTVPGCICAAAYAPILTRSSRQQFSGQDSSSTLITDFPDLTD